MWHRPSSSIVVLDNFLPCSSIWPRCPWFSITFCLCIPWCWFAAFVKHSETWIWSVLRINLVLSLKTKQNTCIVLNRQYFRIICYCGIIIRKQCNSLQYKIPSRNGFQEPFNVFWNTELQHMLGSDAVGVQWFPLKNWLVDWFETIQITVNLNSIVFDCLACWPNLSTLWWILR